MKKSYSANFERLGALKKYIDGKIEDPLAWLKIIETLNIHEPE